MLRELGRQKKVAFYSQMINKNLDILIENSRDKSSGRLKGLTSNYIKVLIDGPDQLKNTIQTVKIMKMVDDNSVYGIDKFLY